MPNTPSTHTFIMIIDTSLTIRKLLQVILSREGYEGATFANGRTALQWLQRSTSQIPDLVLLELALPSMNGYQVARAIHSLPDCKHLPIVLLTQHNRHIDHLMAWLVGVNTFISKPFTTQQIITTARDYLPPGTQNDNYPTRPLPFVNMLDTSPNTIFAE